MQELERQREEGWAERERIREEPDEGRQSKKRHLLFLLLAGMLGAFLFLTYSSSGNELLARVTGATAQPVEEEQTAVPEEPVVEEEQQPAEEEQEAAPETPAEEEEPVNVYAATMTTEVKESLADLPERVYVPNIIDGTITVVDPETFEITDS